MVQLSPGRHCFNLARRNYLKITNLRQAKPALLADIPMLKEDSESYMRMMYKEFEDEYKSQLACLCEPVVMNGTVRTF